MNRRTDAPALEFAGVSLTYHTKEGETLAAADLSFAVEEGEFIAVIGPSGCGKTTLLSLAAGLIAPSSGSIRVRGGEQGAGRFVYMLQRDELSPGGRWNRTSCCRWRSAATARRRRRGARSRSPKNTGWAGF